MSVLSFDLVTVVAGAVASFAIGAVWYSPKLFANAWMESQPHRKKEDYTGAGKAMALQSLATLALSALVNFSVRAVETMDGALEPTAVAVTVIFLSIVLGLMRYAGGLFSGNQTKQIHIDAGYIVVMIVVMGITNLVL